MNTKVEPPVDFLCPFVEGDFACTEVMSPPRATPSNRERKLFVLMTKPERPTKNACPHCSIFLQTWKEQIGVLGHIRYFWTWLNDKEMRNPRPQGQL